jgi:hypothetical protein
MMWIVEMGVWNPNDGDPLAILGYADSFKGNKDYENSVIDDVDSAWCRNYDE